MFRPTLTLSQPLYWILGKPIPVTNQPHREEEEPDEHFYPLTLRTRKTGDRPQSPLDSISVNGGGLQTEEE